jgi:hypothetical protein
MLPWSFPPSVRHVDVSLQIFNLWGKHHICVGSIQSMFPFETCRFSYSQHTYSKNDANVEGKIYY